MSAAALFDAIGWTLLHFVWQGAIVALLVAASLALLGRARPQLRYLLACAGLLACVLWPALELGVRLRHGMASRPVVHVAELIFMAGSGQAASGVLAALQARLPWIVAVWAGCAAALALRMGLGLLWIQRARALPGDAGWQARTARLAARMGIARAVRLCVVPGLASPLTAGWWRPIILLPAALLAGMPPELLEALLAHELAHVRRHDYLVNLLQNLAEVLLFYHPAIWWLSARIRAERELVADDLAAQALGEPRRLALALSELERLQFAGGAGSRALALGANGGDLLARVRRLLRPDQRALGWQAALPALVLALAGASMVAHTALAVPQAERVARNVRPQADFSQCPKPRWPAGAIEAERTGTVTMAFLVGRDGTVKQSRIQRSSGHADLDEAARGSIGQCRFKPGRVDGVTVQAWMQMQYVWTLQ